MSKTSFTLLALVLVLAYAIEGTYKAGVFYREHLHDHVMAGLKSTGAFLVTVSLYAYEGAQYVWTRREDIREACGRALSYQSPMTYKAC